MYSFHILKHNVATVVNTMQINAKDAYCQQDAHPIIWYSFSVHQILVLKHKINIKLPSTHKFVDCDSLFVTLALKCSPLHVDINKHKLHVRSPERNFFI